MTEAGPLLILLLYALSANIHQWRINTIVSINYDQLSKRTRGRPTVKALKIIGRDATVCACVTHVLNAAIIPIKGWRKNVEIQHSETAKCRKSKLRRGENVFLYVPVYWFNTTNNSDAINHDYPLN